MPQKKISRKQIKKERTEDEKLYQRLKDKMAVKVRFSYKELSLLKMMMRDEDWENTAGFIRYKLFGYDPEKRLRSQLKKANEFDVITLVQELETRLEDYEIRMMNRIGTCLETAESNGINVAAVNRLYGLVYDFNHTIVKYRDELIAYLQDVIKAQNEI